MTIHTGTWPLDDLRRAFVEGARWFMYEHYGYTPFANESDEMEAEAEERYPGGKVRPGDVLLDSPEGQALLAELEKGRLDASGPDRERADPPT